ncbi:hypothetical protein RRG08_059024, partial [Elysia crispata]
TQAFVDSLHGPNNTSPGSGPQHAYMPRVRHIPHVAANENLPDDYLICTSHANQRRLVICVPRNLRRVKTAREQLWCIDSIQHNTLDDVEYHVTSSQGHREPPNIYSRVRAGVSFTEHPEPSRPYRNMPGPSGAN